VKVGVDVSHRHALRGLGGAAEHERVLPCGLDGLGGAAHDDPGDPERLDLDAEDREEPFGVHAFLHAGCRHHREPARGRFIGRGGASEQDQCGQEGAPPRAS